MNSFSCFYSEQFCAHRFDNLDEIDQFLERHNLSKLPQEEIDCLNRPVPVKEIESVISYLPEQKKNRLTLIP